MKLVFKLKKIQNNIVVRFLFLSAIFILSFFISFVLGDFFKIKDIKIIMIFSYFFIFLFSFLFKQLDFNSLFKKSKLDKEIFFWSFIYIFNVGFLSDTWSYIFPSLEISDIHIFGNKTFFVLIFITLIGPFCEELFFRGIIFKIFENNSKITIVILSSVLFASLHGIKGIPLLISGSAFYFGYIYLKTKSLWNSITIHVINNAVATFLFLSQNKLLSEGLLFNILGGVSLIIGFYNFFRMYKFLKN